MKTLLTAHSGADGTADNSLEFLDYALSLNVDCAEVDVRMGAHGLALGHDDAHGPSLADAFALLRARPGKKLNCDLKEPGLEVPVFRLACELGAADQLVYSGTVSARAEDALPGLFRRVDWYLNAELLPPGLGAEEIVSALARAGAVCLNAHYSLAEMPLYRDLLRIGVPLSLWTPFDEALLLRLSADGAYNLTTRNARRATELLSALI